MLIDGKMFNSSTSYVDKNTLNSIDGNACWFTEFVPIKVPAIRTLNTLLFHNYRHGLLFYERKFCHLHRGFSIFFQAVSIYMILDDDHAIIHLFLQKGPNVIQNLIIGFFHFELLQRFTIFVSTVCV